MTDIPKLAASLTKAQRDFPTGYFSCCGMAKTRAHANYCPREAILRARSQEDQP